MLCWFWCPKRKCLLKVKVFIKLCSALLNSSSVVSVTSQDVCGSHLLEGRSNVLVAAVNELPAGDVIGDKLGLSELPGQGPLSCGHHFE